MYRADNVRFVSFPDGVGPLWEAEGFSLSSRWLFLCSRNKCSNTQNPLGSKWEETSFRLAPSSRFYDQLLVMNLVSSPPRPSGGRAEKNPVASWPLPISIFCGTQTFWGGSAHLTHRQCVSVCVCVPWGDWSNRRDAHLVQRLCLSFVERAANFFLLSFWFQFPMFQREDRLWKIDILWQGPSFGPNLRLVQVSHVQRFS